MSAIRKSARGETCTFNIPGVCSGDPETVVLCHAPHPDKGMGHKGPDTWAAYGCSNCHDEMDGRTCMVPDFVGSSDSLIRYTTQFVYDATWLIAIRETQRRLIAKGLMPK